MNEPPTPSAQPEHTVCYTLEATLLSGPVEDSFFEDNPVISRTIQIRGDQTLEGLHDIIFTAFDREDDNAYEFRMSGGPHDQTTRIYVLPSELFRKPLKNRSIAGDVTRTRIDALGLKEDDIFTYWFDFENDWTHQITVVSVDGEIPRGKLPRVISRIGESPAQYGDMDGEESDLEFSEDELWNVSY